MDRQEALLQGPGTYQLPLLWPLLPPLLGQEVGRGWTFQVSPSRGTAVALLFVATLNWPHADPRTGPRRPGDTLFSPLLWVRARRDSGNGFFSKKQLLKRKNGGRPAAQSLLWLPALSE